MFEFVVTGIEWDTDDEVVDLPSSAVVSAESHDDIADALSDKYGWCVKGFTTTDSEGV